PPPPTFPSPAGGAAIRIPQPLGPAPQPKTARPRRRRLPPPRTPAANRPPGPTSLNRRRVARAFPASTPSASSRGATAGTKSTPSRRTAPDTPTPTGGPQSDPLSP